MVISKTAQNAALALVAVATAVLVYLAFGANDPPATAGQDRSALEPSEPDDPYVALVVGDSFTGGSAMNDGPTWAEIVADDEGWLLKTDAVGGTGYLAGSATKPPIPKRIAQTVNDNDPDLVIIAGGFNDAGRYPGSAVAAAATETVEAYDAAFPEADVLLLSPWGNGAPSTDQLSLAKALEVVATNVGVDYLDVTKFLASSPDQWIGSDGTHPTNAGHQELAERMSGALETFGYGPTA